MNLLRMQKRPILINYLLNLRVVDAPKKDVSDVIGTFQKPMANTFFCNLHDSNNQIITIIKH